MKTPKEILEVVQKKQKIEKEKVTARRIKEEQEAQLFFENFREDFQSWLEKKIKEKLEKMTVPEDFYYKNFDGYVDFLLTPYQIKKHFPKYKKTFNYKGFHKVLNELAKFGYYWNKENVDDYTVKYTVGWK